MFRYTVSRTPETNTSYLHQFRLSLATPERPPRWTTKQRAAFVSACVQWAEAHVGIYGDRWILRDFMFLFRESEDAVAFKLRWG